MERGAGVRGAVVDMILVTGASCTLALVAHQCRRWDRRHTARLVSMRWDEIARHDRNRSKMQRAGVSVRRAFGRAREALLLTAVCFGAAAVFLVVQS